MDDFGNQACPHTQQRAEVRELVWAQGEVMSNRRRKTREPCNLGRRLKRLRKYSFLNQNVFESKECPMDTRTFCLHDSPF